MAKRVYILIPGRYLFGQEQALFCYAKALRIEHYEVVIISHSKWGELISTKARSEGFQVITANLGDLWEKNILSLMANFWFIVLLNIRFSYHFKRGDTLLIGNITFGSKFLPLIYLKCGLKVIFRHGDSHASHSVLHRAINFMTLRRADKTIANSESLRSRYARYTNFIKIIRNTIDPIRLEYGGSQVNNNFKNPLTFTYIGQIAEHKGVLELLTAIEKSQTKPKFFIVGSNNSKKEQYFYDSVTRRIMNLKNVEHIKYTDDITQVLERTNILICPSLKHDPSPNVVIEAKSYGIPSIIFDAEGINEMIHHKCDGFVCTTKDYNGILEAIEFFVNDPRKIQEMSENAVIDFENRYHWNNFRRQIKELIN